MSNLFSDVFMNNPHPSSFLLPAFPFFSAEIIIPQHTGTHSEHRCVSPITDVRKSTFVLSPSWLPKNAGDCPSNSTLPPHFVLSFCKAFFHPPRKKSANLQSLFPNKFDIWPLANCRILPWCGVALTAAMQRKQQWGLHQPSHPLLYFTATKPPSIRK